MAVFFVSVIICFIILEIAVRKLFPAFNPSYMWRSRNYDGVILGIKNSTFRHKHPLGDFDINIKINKYGFRDEKDISKSTPNDLLVVGDSFSFGHGVEEDKRYSNLLEKMIGIPVYNISIPVEIDGYAALVRYAKQNGAKMDNLIITICMENDLIDYEKKESYYKSKAYENKKFKSFKKFLRKNSAFFNMINYLIVNNETLYKLAIKLGLLSHYRDFIRKNEYSEKIILSSVNKLLEITQQFDNVTVIVIPSRALWVGDNQETELKIHNRFCELLRENQLDIIDLRLIYEEGDDPFQYLFEHDGHWSEKGHLKVAEILSKHLKDKLGMGISEKISTNGAIY